MRRKQLHTLTKGYALVIEWVKYLQKVHSLLFALRETEIGHQTLELLLCDDSVRVMIDLSIEFSKGSQVGFVLAHLEVKQGAQEIGEVNFDLSWFIELLLEHMLLFSCHADIRTDSSR